MPSASIAEAAAKLTRKYSEFNEASAATAWRAGIGVGQAKLSSQGFGPEFMRKWQSGVSAGNYRKGDAQLTGQRWAAKVAR